MRKPPAYLSPQRAAGPQAAAVMTANRHNGTSGSRCEHGHLRVRPVSGWTRLRLFPVCVFAMAAGRVRARAIHYAKDDMVVRGAVFAAVAMPFALRGFGLSWPGLLAVGCATVLVVFAWVAITYLSPGRGKRVWCATVAGRPGIAVWAYLERCDETGRAWQGRGLVGFRTRGFAVELLQHTCQCRRPDRVAVSFTAANDKLARYYEQHGFRRSGPPLDSLLARGRQPMHWARHRD